MGGMKRIHAAGHRHRPNPRPADARSIDAKYGLEPVFEPGSDTDATLGDVQLRLVQCPYCGEGFDTLVDLSSGAARYIEDCQVCCQPIQFDLEVDHDGRLVALTASRGD